MNEWKKLREYVAHCNRGVDFEHQGKPEDAVAEYRAAIRRNPRVALPHYNLGAALEAQGKLEEAVAEFRTAIRLKPDDAVAHFALGVTLKDQGKLEEAVAEFRKARTNAKRGSELAQAIERALTDAGH